MDLFVLVSILRITSRVQSIIILALCLDCVAKFSIYFGTMLLIPFLATGILDCEAPLQDPAHFLELLASSQARRLDDQRVSLSHFPGLRLSICNRPSTPSTSSENQDPSQGDERWYSNSSQVFTFTSASNDFPACSFQPPFPMQIQLTHPPNTAATRPALTSWREMMSSLTCLLSARWARRFTGFNYSTSSYSSSNNSQENQIHLWCLMWGIHTK